jgi:hypothetical protein
MGHDISLTHKGETLNCFPPLQGNVACREVDGKLVPLDLQSNLYITHNNSSMWYSALENIKKPKDSIGEWLDGSKAGDVIETLEKTYIELTSNREIYEPLQPEPHEGTRWGGYLDLCQKIQCLLIACRSIPDATIEDFY